MDTKKLRQKILDLAIRGKLVPQDPNDEPASVLLERIRAEKERLIAEGKIKRSKKSATSDTPHYENVPFEVPKGWMWAMGLDIFKPMKTAFPTGETFNYIDIDAIDNKRNIITAVKVINTNQAPSRASRYTEKGCVLFSMVRPYLRNIAIVLENNCIASTGFFVCHTKNCLLPKFCYYQMLSNYVVDGLNNFIKGDNSPSITKGQIETFLFPIPPREEQKRIVSVIEQWFTLINILEDAKGDLQNLISQAKSKILDLAIHGKLVPQDPTDEPAIELLKRINPKFTPCDNEHYGNLPNGWCICRIRDLFQICMGQSPAGTSINQNDGMEFHQGKICFTDKFLGQSKILTNSPTKIADANSLLICVRAPVGVLNINTRQICIGRGLCALLPSKCVNLGFAFHCLTTYQQQFEQKSTGSTFKAISGDIIKNELFPLPPLAEQHRIVAKIEELFAQLDAIENSLQA